MAAPSSDAAGRNLADKTAIGLSLLCAAHCLALPVLVLLLPAVGSTIMADEAFHLWLLVAVVPISTYALAAGFFKHRRGSLLLTGFSGVLLLAVAAVLGHDLFGELGERLLSLVGAALIAWSHWKNYRSCRSATAAEQVPLGADHGG